MGTGAGVGTNKTLCALGPRGKEQRSHKSLSHSCLWVFKSLLQRRGSAVTFCGDRGTGSSGPGRCGVLAQVLLEQIAISPKIDPVAYHRPAGWVTLKLENSHTGKVHTLVQRFWTPHQASQPEEPAKELGIPEPSKSVDFQYAPGKEWRNSCKRNEEAESKQKLCPLVDVSGDESKV